MNSILALREATCTHSKLTNAQTSGGKGGRLVQFESIPRSLRSSFLIASGLFRYEHVFVHVHAGTATCTSTSPSAFTMVLVQQ